MKCLRDIAHSVQSASSALLPIGDAGRPPERTRQKDNIAPIAPQVKEAVGAYSLPSHEGLQIL